LGYFLSPSGLAPPRLAQRGPGMPGPYGSRLALIRPTQSTALSLTVGAGDRRDVDGIEFNVATLGADTCLQIGFLGFVKHDRIWITIDGDYEWDPCFPPPR